MKDQTKTPYFDEMKAYCELDHVPLDVPGHHMGCQEDELKEFLGPLVYRFDANSPRCIDNLNHPSGALQEAMDLMADAYEAKHAYYLINGTSSGIIAMILATCSDNDKIILPRNSHKSAIGALTLSGAYPIFINPSFDTELGIANQPSYEDYEKAILANPDAKAVFVINATYFGVVTDLKRIVDLAHKHNMYCIVDEAHGAHFNFDHYGPISAMRAGADLSAASIHKTCGSLTQTSVLLSNGNISHNHIIKILSLINTTSPSMILLASLDTARKYTALYGEEKLKEVKKLGDYARKEINKIPGFHLYGREYFKSKGEFDYDETKLLVSIDRLDISGFDLFNIIHDDYGIQLELGERYVGLGILALGTRKEHIDRLIRALQDMSKRFYDPKLNLPKNYYESINSITRMKPRDAFLAELEKVKLDEAIGRISKEAIMTYPPGIPIIIPGEEITKEIVERIKYYQTTKTRVIMDYPEGYLACVKIK